MLAYSKLLTNLNRSLPSKLHPRRALSLHAYVEHPSLVVQIENILKNPSELNIFTESLKLTTEDVRSIEMPNLSQSLELVQSTTSSLQFQLDNAVSSVAAQFNKLAQDATPQDVHPFQDLASALKSAEDLEVQSVLQLTSSLVATVWTFLTSPFAVFGPDMGLVNALFVISFLLIAYNIILQTPRQ
ncbi:hypothetical protein CEUSTIGMA_g7738.t1 [Chlamydomonas eustigma]|uniref:Uncharacterized protein n=1 Tax=Chlamydomonas eustigma TaxID=1157962 RepID=A0A250XC12_9CHLO|nr:hypothetical protein CEUSTIGMA_g7738.t1 [Chlamydomonas eustigma]|eukprot:GAX80300.1 hypothetical protein CEUSTIGMA_g7738.t1 [Chlamydomonas eustigma]